MVFSSKRIAITRQAIAGAFFMDNSDESGLARKDVSSRFRS